MKSFLARRWFLLLLVAGLVLAGLRPDWPQPATEQVPPRAVVTLALFLMAWGLDSHSLKQALFHPLPALWAVAITYGALPALAWLIGPLMPSDDLRIGLMITASVPCTLASAVLWTRLAGGNEATALLVILLTTCTSWLATPFWLIFGTGISVAVNFGELMRDLLLFLVLPVCVAQLSRTLGPVARLVSRLRRPISLAAQLLVFSVIMKAAVDARLGLVERSGALSLVDLLTAAVLCMGVHVAALCGGLGSGRLLGFDRGNRVAVAFACSQKTLPVALLLFESYFRRQHPLALVPLVIYHVGQLFVDTFIADLLAPRKPRATDAPIEAVD